METFRTIDAAGRVDRVDLGEVGPLVSLSASARPKFEGEADYSSRCLNGLKL